MRRWCSACAQARNQPAARCPAVRGAHSAACRSPTPRAPERRVRGAPGRAQPQPQGSARGEPEAAVGRLAVHENRQRFTRDSPFRAIAARSSPTTKSIPTRVSPARFIRSAQPPALREYFRVARSPADNAVPFQSAWKKRRHAVEMRREHNLGMEASIGRREDVEALTVHWQLGDGESQSAQYLQAIGPPRLRGRWSSRVNKRAGQRDRINRVHGFTRFTGFTGLHGVHGFTGFTGFRPSGSSF